MAIRICLFGRIFRVESGGGKRLVMGHRLRKGFRGLRFRRFGLKWDKATARYARRNKKALVTAEGGCAT